MAHGEGLAGAPHRVEQTDGQSGAIDITRQVFCREAHIDEGFLDVAAHGRIDLHGARVYLAGDELADLALAADLQHEERVFRAEQQAAIRCAAQLQPPEARDVVPHIGLDVAGDIVLAVLGQGLEDGICIQPAGGCVPQRQRRQPVGVDVFGAFLQLRKARQRVARLLVAGVIDLQQDGPIALHDHRIQRISGHNTLRFPRLD